MRLAEAKVVHSDYTFAVSKLGEILYCDVCNAPRCIYSKKSMGEPNGPGKLQACVLDQWTESEYTCEKEVSVEGFYAQQKLSFSETVKTNYYNPLLGQKLG